MAAAFQTGHSYLGQSFSELGRKTDSLPCRNSQIYTSKRFNVPADSVSQIHAAQIAGVVAIVGQQHPDPEHRRERTERREVRRRRSALPVRALPSERAAREQPFAPAVVPLGKRGERGHRPARKPSSYLERAIAAGCGIRPGLRAVNLIADFLSRRAVALKCLDLTNGKREVQVKARQFVIAAHLA